VVNKLESLFNITIEVDIVVYELEELLNITVEEVIAAVCELKELLNVTVEVDMVVYELEDLVPSDTPGNRDYSFANKQVIPNSQPSDQPITPDATIKTASSNSKKKKTR
jgi:hypothetical protein